MMTNAEESSGAHSVAESTVAINRFDKQLAVRTENP